MKEELYKALKLKYEAKQQEARANLRLYFSDAIAVADHPDLVASVDKLFREYVEATEYLKLLEGDVYELIKNQRLL
tara:strand:- start:691 stop:918 length:228 start_codon:yes stop_codon:yes gene_type:complete